MTGGITMSRFTFELPLSRTCPQTGGDTAASFSGWYRLQQALCWRAAQKPVVTMQCFTLLDTRVVDVEHTRFVGVRARPHLDHRHHAL